MTTLCNDLVMEGERSGGDAAELDRAIDVVQPMFQPVVWLDDLSIAGYESLARGPVGSPLERPTDLFDAARAVGRITEVDSTMTRRSIEALGHVAWHPSQTLFGNLDPDAMRGRPDEATLATLAAADAAGLRIVVEITERSLLRDPASLVRSIEAVRSRGWGIAMDDVGAEEDSLTLLPLLQPDIVKLDMSVLHRPFDAHAARVSGTIRSYCDRTGALMICEGVERETHAVRARALGADLVQGFMYGEAAPLPEMVAPATRPISLRGLAVREERPLAARIGPVPEASLPGIQIVALADELLAIVAGHTTAAIVITSAPAFDDVPREYLDALAAAVPHAALVAIIAPGCPSEPATGVRGVDTSVGAMLGSPWSISVIGPTMAVSVLAEPLGDDLLDPVCHRVVHDRSLVAQILLTLLGELTG